MAKKKKLYNPELDKYDVYTEVWRQEIIDVKGEKISVLNHYWEDSKGELWGDFDNPMENIYRGFDEYRRQKGYLSPMEIKDIRKKLKLSVRQFAHALGISSSALTQIENNHRVQAKYQDVLFKLVRADPQSFIDNILQKN